MSVCIARCRSVRNGQKKTHKPWTSPFNPASATTMFSRRAAAPAVCRGRTRTT